jgi:hypothetical protein
MYRLGLEWEASLTPWIITSVPNNGKAKNVPTQTVLVSYINTLH